MGLLKFTRYYEIFPSGYCIINSEGRFCMKAKIVDLALHLANPESLKCKFSSKQYSIIDESKYIAFQIDQRTITYSKQAIGAERYTKYTGIYMVYNEYSISNIRNLLDVINQKGAAVYFYYDNIECFYAFFELQQNKTIYQEQDEFLLFFSEQDIESYFKLDDSQYPRIYLNMPKDLKQVITMQKNKEIIFLRQQMDEYYKNKSLKNLQDQLKILICSDLFNMGTVGCMAKEYEAAFDQIGIDYRLTVKDYNRFHYYEEVYFLRAVMDYKPSAIIGMNVSYASFPYYISSHLPIISQIDSGQYATNENCYRNKGEYTVFLLPFVSLGNIFSKEFIKSDAFLNKVIAMPFVADHEVYKKYMLTQKEKNKYKADVCFVGNSTTSRDVLYRDLVNTHERFFMKGANTEKRKDYQTFIKSIFDECFDLTYEKETFLGYNDFFEKYMLRKSSQTSCFLGKLEKKELHDFIFMMESYLLAAIYRICIMDWVLNWEFNIKIFGMRWSNDEKYNKLWGGEIENGKELSKVYNASKIVIHSNIVHGVHRRFFEATLSGCLCICPRPKKKINLSGLETYFKEDEAVVYFDNKRDLYRKIKYYLEHDEERKKIVNNCRCVIYEKNLYARFVYSQSILKAIGEIEKEAGNSLF